ncbi:hypothetical protein LTS18_002333, partial [Coniosporium uncinatum]
IASHGSFFNQLSEKVASEGEDTFALIQSNECPNLKTLLGTLIKKATLSGRNFDDEDEDGPISRPRKGPRLLSYDLRLLFKWMQENSMERAVVAFQDSEALDGNLIAEVVDVLSAWSDRINFVLLFGIATSVENFHEKLPRATLRLLEGQQFDAAQSEEILEKVFWKSVDDPHLALRIGPDLTQMLLDVQRDHVQSVAVFIDSIKYACMSHCFANQVSVFLKGDLGFDEVTKEDMEALRNLPSFRELCESLLQAKDIKLLRKLISSDRELFEYAREHIVLGQETLHNITTGISAFQTAHALIPKT